jgi:hypothetical protein
VSGDDLLARARERADARAIPEDWGYRVRLDEEESFVGRWRGRGVDENWTPVREIFFAWDCDDEPCFFRYYAALGREIERVTPTIGDRIAIWRGVDYTTQEGNTGYSFGVEVEPCSNSLPGEPAGAHDGIPF